LSERALLDRPVGVAICDERRGLRLVTMCPVPPTRRSSCSGPREPRARPRAETLTEAPLRTRATHHRYERHRGAASAPLPRRYRPRRPQATAYHGVIAQHLETMLEAARARSSHGFGLP